jgi:ubiquinone/menaquinone biosynthesis C-methylase UbiE
MQKTSRNLMSNVDYEKILFCDRANLTAGSKNLAGLKLHRFLGKLATIPAEGSVLEFACGVGTFTKFIQQSSRNYQTTGIDISSNALAKGVESIPGASFIKADVGNLPFKNSSFDMLCGFDILEHVADIETVFAEISRVTKPGGVIHFHVPCEGQKFSIWHILKKLKLGGDIKKKHAGHIQQFAFQDIMSLCKSYGFRIMDMKYSYHLFGQILDLIQWYAFLFRFNRSKGDVPKNNSDQDADTGISITFKVLLFLYRIIISVLEKISYYESVILSNVTVSMAFDITAVRSQELQLENYSSLEGNE